MRLAAVIALAAVAVAVSSLGLIASVPSSTPYSPFNDGPRGYSTMAGITGAEPVISIEGSGGTLIIPLAHGLSDEEMRAVASFVASGGRVVIIDEGGYSNTLLSEYLNLSIAVVAAPVLDYVLNYDGNSSIPLINASVNGNIFTCYFLKPSSISLLNGSAEVIATTSRLSFRDNDRSGFFSLGDQFGPFPVAVVSGTVAGRVYVITDLDAFSNSLISLGNNSEFLKLVIGEGQASVYLGGLNTTPVDIIKTYLSRGRGVIDEVVELGSLTAIAAVIIYGRRAGVFG